MRAQDLLGLLGISALGITLLAGSLAAQSGGKKPPSTDATRIGPLCQTGCIPPYEVRVTPDGGNGGSKPHHTGGYSASFTVRNSGTEYDEYNLNCDLSSGSVICTGLNKTGIGLAGGAQGSVTAFYGVGDAGPGTVTLRAMSVLGDASDNGYYNVTATGTPGAPLVTLRNHNGDNRNRALCLTAGAGEASAWQCGDLLVTHGLPAYATMGRERSLALLYNSAQAVPKPVASVAVTQGGNVSAPDSIHVEFQVNGIPRATATYATWGAVPATGRQISLTYDASTDSTGLYPFTVLVRNKYSTGTYDATVSDTLMVVNRAQSQLGAGWSLMGVEQLRLGQPANRILWVGGDGSAKVYRSVNDSTWVSAAAQFRDTLRYTLADTTYVRTLRHGIQVKFDAQGRHIKTINRIGQVSRSYWTTSLNRLDSVAVPPAGVTGTMYRLSYDGAGKLDRITDPAGRILDATVATNRLTALVDPDDRSTGFGYDASGRMTSRTTRRGFTTKFAYAKGLRVTQVKVPLNPSQADTATTALTPWDEWGLAFGTGLQTAIDTATAHTKIDGPRTDVFDIAEFWVDRWGAPTRILDPVGAVTTITRGDAAVPAMPTRVTFADGRVADMQWDTRGNLTQSRDSTLHLGSAGLPTIVKRWTYSSPNTKDAPDAQFDSTETGAVVTLFAYNQWGMTDSVIAPNGHRTKIEYLRGLVQALIERQVPSWDTVALAEPPQDLRTAFAFNALGNVIADTSPMHRVRTYTRDSVQRVTNGYDPEGHRLELVYDPLNHVTAALQHVEGVDSGFAAPLVTHWYFGIDAIDSLVDPRGVARRFAYDAAGHPVRETDDFGHAEQRYFNRAGLVDSIRSRFDSGATTPPIRFAYDAAGRRTKMSWPGRLYINADSVLVSYDNMGRMLTAATTVRRVTRSYFATGAIQRETQSSPSGASPYTNTYSYDRVGRRSGYAMGVPGDALRNDSVWYRYDPASGDLRTIGVRWRGQRSPSTDSVKFAWDALGRRDTVRYSNNTVVKFAYDADGRRRLLCGDHPGGIENFDVLDFTVYHASMDRDGMTRRLTNVSSGIAGCSSNSTLNATADNTYDSRHQLRTSTVPHSSSYTYDGSGNLSVAKIWAPNVVLLHDVYRVDSLHNELVNSRSVSKPDSGMDFFYNVNGSRIEEIPVSGNIERPFTEGHRQYFYDGLERLSGTVGYVKLGGVVQYVGSPNDCKYDPLGRLFDPCENAAAWLGFDGHNVVRTASDSMAQSWTFVHGPGVDDPVMGYYQALSQVDDRHLYWITDGQGRQYAVGDAAGYDYTEDNRYVLPQNGGKFAGGVRNATSYDAERFQNPEQPRLSFFRNRFYDQGTGRWTQEDPIGMAGGINLYSYAGNNPVAYTDPFGLRTCAEIRADIKQHLKKLIKEWWKFYDYTRAGRSTPGHWQEVVDLQKGLVTRLGEYVNEGCLDKDDHDDFTPEYERALDWARRPIAVPSTGLPEPMPFQRCESRWVRAAAGLAIVGSAIEDILTLGAGLADDPVTIAPATFILLCGHL